MLEDLGGPVLCTQPRRLAVVSIARRVAEERGVPLGGDEVGYRIGQRPHYSSSTAIVFATAGVLLEDLKGEGEGGGGGGAGRRRCALQSRGASWRRVGVPYSCVRCCAQHGPGIGRQLARPTGSALAPDPAICSPGRSGADPVQGHCAG